jgi:uncharacterized membrane protein YhfC
MVPAISFAAMAISAALSIGVPIALFFVVRKSYGKGFLPVFLGGAGFLLFAIILEQTLHWLVFRYAPALKQRPFLYVLYGALAAGVFEETARFAAFHILKKRRTGFGVALKHGIGHGGVEAVLLGGASMISSMALAALFNTLGAENLAMMGAPVLEQARAVAATPPSMLFLAGAERLLALAIQISLSAIVFYAVYQPRKLWLFPLAILLHAVADCPAALAQAGVIESVWLVEGLAAVSAAALAAFAVLLHKRLEPKETPPA